jgi:hypothetical protein
MECRKQVEQMMRGVKVEGLEKEHSHQQEQQQQMMPLPLLHFVFVFVLYCTQIPLC